MSTSGSRDGLGGGAKGSVFLLLGLDCGTGGWKVYAMINKDSRVASEPSFPHYMLLGIQGYGNPVNGSQLPGSLMTQCQSRARPQQLPTLVQAETRDTSAAWRVKERVDSELCIVDE